MTLKLVYPEFANAQLFPNANGKTDLVWKQSSSPLDSSVSGFSIAPNAQHDWDGYDDFKGMCRSSQTAHTLLDGQPEHGHWYYAIGAHTSWGGTNHFPGPRGSQNVAYNGEAKVSYVELWVKKKWELLVKHDATSNQFFPKNTLDYRSSNGKLIMNLAHDYGNFRGADGKMTMKLVYPEFANAQLFPKANGITELAWKQSSSPLDSSVSGFSIVPNTQHDWDGYDDFKGMCRSSLTTATVLDGQPEHGHWYYAVGAHRSWGGRNHFPGPRGSQNVAYNGEAKVSYVELWVLRTEATTLAPTKSPTANPTNVPTNNPTNNPTKSPTASPTESPTASPTMSPTARCDANNCMNWNCVDWCECYDESDVHIYESHVECQDDNDDTCICFENDEHDLNGERHREINYNQDAVDAGTAALIEGTDIHAATKQYHYQEAGATTMKLIDFVKISAVAEGKGHNKAITLKNVGCREVNLDEYKLILWSNTANKGGAAFRANPTGRNNGVTQIPSGTTLAPGASYTICHPKNTYTQRCDFLSNKINHNGKKQDFLQLKRD